MKLTLNREDIFNNAMVCDVMVANPQSAKSELLVSFLENRFVPMPDYMMDQIMAGVDTVGLFESIHSVKCDWIRKYNHSYKNILRELENRDSYTINSDSIVSIMKSRNDIEGNTGLVNWYRFRSMTDSAWYYLQTISQILGMSGYPDYNIYNQESLFSILEQIKNDTCGQLRIDSVRYQSLVGLWADDESYAAVASRNLLQATGKIIYHEPVFIPLENTLKSSKKNKYSGCVYDSQVDKLTVYPNPAGTYITIEYNFNEKPANSAITITDVGGALK